jgi:cell division septal protein FtsQ
MRYQYYASQYPTIAESLSLQALPAIDTGRISKLIAFGLLVTLAWVLYSVFTSPSFYVSDAEVRGNAMVSAREIYAASQLDGMSIFWVDTEAVRSRMEALPGVKSAWVKTSLPAAVTISIAERMPQLVWKTGDATWWIDTEGTVIQPRGVLERAITLTDVDSEPLEVGGSIAASVLARIAALHDLLPDLSEMLYSPSLGIGFTTGEGWPVYLGDERDMETKLTVVKALRKQLLERGITPQLIDVQFPQRPFYR